MHRLYENDDITVFWDSDKCFHAKRCVTGCPGVFEFGRRPWIILENAENPDIWKTVKKCPSGGLDIVYNHGVKIVFDEENCRSIALDGEKRIGECEYRDDGEGFTIYHTGVDPEYSGRGIAKRLVFKVAEAAEKRKRKIIPVCSYAVKVLQNEKKI